MKTKVQLGILCLSFAIIAFGKPIHAQTLQGNQSSSAPFGVVSKGTEQKLTSRTDLKTEVHVAPMVQSKKTFGTETATVNGNNSLRKNKTASKIFYPEKNAASGSFGINPAKQQDNNK